MNKSLMALDSKNIINKLIEACSEDVMICTNFFRYTTDGLTLSLSMCKIERIEAGVYHLSGFSDGTHVFQERGGKKFRQIKLVPLGDSLHLVCGIENDADARALFDVEWTRVPQELPPKGGMRKRGSKFSVPGAKPGRPAPKGFGARSRESR